MSLDEKKTEGNPKGSETNEVEDAIFGSPDSFFNAVEQDVNSMVMDESESEQPVTSPMESSEVQDTDVSGSHDEIETLKKRYSDSSREAQRLAAEKKEIEPFIPLLEAMKQDGNLVDYVREYFTKGGDVPGNIKEKLDLDEDFEMDMNDVVNDGKSDSKKVFDAMVDTAVSKKVNVALDGERQKVEQTRRTHKAKQEAMTFKEQYGLTDDEFSSFVTEAKDHYNKNGLTFEDMYLLMNKDKVKTNIASSTKEDMIKQMKTVRDIPTSQSGSNNATEKKTDVNDMVFESLLGLDGDSDNLFG